MKFAMKSTIKSVTMANAAILGALLCLGGCTSVPQAELNQANNGASLLMGMNAAVDNFKSTQTAIVKIRLAAQKDMLNRLAQFKSGTGFDDRAAAAAGVSGAGDLVKKLTDLADSRLKDQQDLDAQIAAIDKTYAGILTALPNQAPAITSTRDEMVKMGEQMSAKEQLQLLAGFAKGLKSVYEADKKAIEDSASQTDASLPPPPPAAAGK